jgi:hypothetical protein
MFKSRSSILWYIMLCVAMKVNPALLVTCFACSVTPKKEVTYPYETSVHSQLVTSRYVPE